jgi:hypothetical protein
MAFVCCAFDNSPYLFTLVRLDQHIVGTMLQDIDPKLVITQA